MIDVITVDAPSVPDSTEIFQITLPNGAIMTRAYGFESGVDVIQHQPMVGQNGELLSGAFHR